MGEGVLMLSNKIEITEEIRTIIKNKREEKKIPARDLSMKYLGKSQGYISSLENGRVKFLKRNDIIKIFEILYNINEELASTKIINIVNSSKKSDINLSKDVNFEKTLKPLNDSNIQSYETIEDPINQETGGNLVDNLKLGFETVYKKRPDFTISTLKRFVVSFHFDLAFMMVILRTPYFALEELNHDERQSFLNEFSEIFKKYAILSKEHRDEQKKNDKLQSADDESDEEETQDFHTDSDSNDNKS